ncbi:cyclin-dependent kinase F-4-like [Cynara cardunculus var. scolymus]|uniref:Protein kinase, ATP binding site-containing protein n=1 Tax=Cynara cardunculus var. scolymus TaxID=59895 RepID=A0A103Y6Q1_CYNCS|nr:cyclin-dependent kinase F-4-like [Cynara cardunculus var. scolymus]KVI03530.1 Protein kinase, ATP binding site-containing protein [Cynara cardunculus var. scolymus]
MEKYQRIKEIGRGSYGVVYKALNTENGELVAVKKMIGRKYYSSKECMNLREVKSLCKMRNHPNIVKLKEVIVQKNILFLVFEYMECTLFDRMRDRTNPYSETEIRNLCFQIFQGLAYMHGTGGYFHRDLKPENLLVSKDVIKIADLGQAREINGEPPYTHYVSTRRYRAPEVLLHAMEHDSSVDMWAMGAIMVELFTLRPLFQGSSTTDVIRKICSVIGSPTDATWSLFNYRFPEFPGVDLSSLLPSASPEAINLISTLLSWSPCARPTAKEALEHPFFYGCSHIPHPQFERVTLSPMIRNRALPVRVRSRI